MKRQLQVIIGRPGSRILLLKSFGNYWPKRIRYLGTSLVVQWLRLHASNARGEHSIPVRRTKIPHAVQHSQENLKKKKNLKNKVSISPNQPLPSAVLPRVPGPPSTRSSKPEMGEPSLIPPSPFIANISSNPSNFTSQM